MILPKLLSIDWLHFWYIDFWSLYSRRRSNSTQMLANLKMQHSFPESIDSALFAADFLRNICI